ncbi:MAG: hypothetical protein K2H38_11250 [Muribaculaceae bacterium]|nr:hypothetical protein [Muribaculaceae bacterium]
MFIPLIPKDPERNDFTCRDGEIDFVIFMGGGHSDRQPVGLTVNDNANSEGAYGAAVRMTAGREACQSIIRIPLQAGDKPKAELMLGGEISRVDPATAERLTQAIVQKAAEALLDLSTDLRRQGLFILPFRFFTMTRLPDGTLSYPSPQGVALPSDFPPHPEITAASTTDDCLTLSIRFPVRPHRLTVASTDGRFPNLPEGCQLRTFISYPLYIPDPKEMRGNIGSVRSATGGNATGIRFAFLSSSAIKASVAAPEKYYELVGNERTGYRLSSKATAIPDYSCYAGLHGYVPPFGRESLLALGEGVDADTDPLDWIADWYKTEGGYLPASLPYIYIHDAAVGIDDVAWPEGIDAEAVLAEAEAIDAGGVLLTRPMTFASDAQSRRNAKPRSIRDIRIVGLDSSEPALGILYGSDDGLRWTPLRRFDPRVRTSVLTPPRLFWRLLLFSCDTPLAIEVR